MISTDVAKARAGGGDVLTSLEGTSSRRGLDAMASRLGELRAWLDDDLTEVEATLDRVAAGETLADKVARHLLDLKGKRLRPVCVGLASRVGGAFTPAAKQLAVAVELVHAATLLHDDVVDLGDLRRGAPAARVVFGNAASIFGGDFLLVDALQRIQAVGLPDVLVAMLEVIREMVVAETLQLERRGKVSGSAAEYFEVVEGKTASLFRWAMFAGARAGGVSPEATAALERYGHKLGVAFQIVDDVLDVVGDPAETGKSALVDLREGKMTYPILVAVERDPSLASALEAMCSAEGEGGAAPALEARIARALTEPEVARASLSLAEALAAEAVSSLEAVPVGPARAALEDVARGALKRRK